jgi:hypothetical protein
MAMTRKLYTSTKLRTSENGDDQSGPRPIEADRSISLVTFLEKCTNAQKSRRIAETRRRALAAISPDRRRSRAAGRGWVGWVGGLGIGPAAVALFDGVVVAWIDLSVYPRAIASVVDSFKDDIALGLGDLA